MALASITIDAPVIAAVPALESKLAMDFDITIPGGMKVSMPASIGATSECKLLVDYMLPSISLSMAPFGALFCLFEVVQALKAGVDAVPDAIAGSPTALTNAISDIATKITCVTGAIPTITVPVMLRDTIDYLDAMLSCVIDSLNNIQSNITTINSALATAQKAEYRTALTSALSVQNASVDSVTLQLKPMQPIFAVMNVLLGLIPGGLSISFSQPAAGTSIADLITALTGLKSTLATLRAALP